MKTLGYTLVAIAALAALAAIWLPGQWWQWLSHRRCGALRGGCDSGKPGPQMNQFSADDERIGHRLMIDRIRAEQVKNEPEPDHSPWWDEIYAFGQAEPIDRYWCCDWHRFHAGQEDHT